MGINLLDSIMACVYAFDRIKPDIEVRKANQGLRIASGKAHPELVGKVG
jgi:hypothetical protein